MADSGPAEQLAAASRQLALGSREAESAFGPALGDAAEAVEAVEEWAHSAAWDLSEIFEVSWSDSIEEDLQTLDYLASQWEQPPDEEALLQIALTWGALLGERVIQSVGGHWVYRQAALHHAVSFPRQQIEFFPMHAVLARFLVGEGASFEAGYQQLVGFLTGS